MAHTSMLCAMHPTAVQAQRRAARLRADAWIGNARNGWMFNDLQQSAGICRNLQFAGHCEKRSHRAKKDHNSFSGLRIRPAGACRLYPEARRALGELGMFHVEH